MKALGLKELSQPSKYFLEALAEAYGKANGWDIRRQILSIKAALATYKAISVFMPGLSRYHYTIADLAVWAWRFHDIPTISESKS